MPWPGRMPESVEIDDLHGRLTKIGPCRQFLQKHAPFTFTYQGDEALRLMNDSPRAPAIPQHRRFPCCNRPCKYRPDDSRRTPQLVNRDCGWLIVGVTCCTTRSISRSSINSLKWRTHGPTRPGGPNAAPGKVCIPHLNDAKPESYDMGWQQFHGARLHGAQFHLQTMGA